MTNIFSPKRNFYISYVKGLAIFYMIIIHLVDWSDLHLGFTANMMKEVLHTSLIFFVTLTGANIIQAYGNYENLGKPIRKLYKRILILLAIYFAYNIGKYYIFDFSTSSFYLQFIEKQTFNLSGILNFKSFTSPITVLIMDSAFLFLSPLLLYVNKNFKYKKSFILGLIIIILIINYGIILPNYLPLNPTDPYFPINRNIVLDILYANGFVLFPMALWAVPYLVGSLLAMLGFEKRRHEAIMIFSIITVVLGALKLSNNESLLLNPYIFPLMPYYVFVCFFAMFIFIQCFMWLEKIRSKKINLLLSTFRLFGDKSLKIYIYHWLVIDISIRIFFPYIKSMWLVMILYLGFFIYSNRKTILEYNEYGYKINHYRSKDSKDTSMMIGLNNTETIPVKE
ncbi:MAG: hypothetical protein PHS92_00795 [Candidatus Gracilibacteria bacterium]|nr:hypothetical protein [Candidatus Gracilibacteria bacterium]